MNKLQLAFAFAVAVLLSVPGVRAAEHEGHGEHGKKADNAPKQESADKDSIEKQKATYPLTTCVVTGEKLGGDMGAPIDYVHKGRLVRFCCKGCVKKFEKEPDKYLALIDEAAKKAAEAAKTEGGKDDAKKTPPKDEAKPKHSGHGGGCCP